MAGYRDIKTHQEVTISRAITAYRDGKTVYLDKAGGKQLINPETGNLLEPIPHDGSEIEAPAIRTDTASRWARNHKYFKDRANKHDKSEETQYNRKKKEKQELTNYTGIKHE